jgi:F0F1-type ATP synthase membrane subunit c/vacuolar-type H+-ATPase subunit K
MASGPVVLIVVVLLSFTESGSVASFLTALVAGLALVAAAWLVPGLRLSPLDPGQRADPVASAHVLRSTAVVTMALAEAPVLIGLVIAFVTNGWLPALAGGVIATAGLLVFGPTRARLGSWKERLEEHGARTGL